MSTSAPLCLLIAALDRFRLGIPLDAVERVVMAAEITPLADTPETIAGVVNVHGEITPVVELRKRFRLPSKALEPSDQFVILRLEGRALAVTVDEAVDVAQFEPEALLPAQDVLPWLDRSQGVVRLEDGLLVVKDPARFLDVEDWNALIERMEESA